MFSSCCSLLVHAAKIEMMIRGEGGFKARSQRAADYKEFNLCVILSQQALGTSALRYFVEMSTFFILISYFFVFELFIRVFRVWGFQWLLGYFRVFLTSVAFWLFGLPGFCSLLVASWPLVANVIIYIYIFGYIWHITSTMPQYLNAANIMQTKGRRT